MSYINEDELNRRLAIIRAAEARKRQRRADAIIKKRIALLPKCQQCDPQIIKGSSATLVDWTTWKGLDIPRVIDIVSGYFHLDPDMLIKKTRKREIVMARQIAMYMLKSKTRLSLKAIGMGFGGRDHTTVIHSCQMVRDLMDIDSGYAEDVKYIDTLIN